MALENNQRFQYLFSRFVVDDLQENELKELFDHLGSEQSARQLRGMIAEQMNADLDFSYEDVAIPKQIDKVYASLSDSINKDLPSGKLVFLQKRYLTIIAAAVILAFITITAFFYHFKDRRTNTNFTDPSVASIVPGAENVAYLTLEDGSILKLDQVQQGTIVQQANTLVEKVANGLITYRKNAGDYSLGVTNTLHTPHGGQYSIVLPDGTKVWLNATSSLSFPTKFSSNNREVRLKGEAYFEVSPDKQRPFVVQSDQVRVEVLGTSFNINSYKDEPAFTVTLTSGMIKLNAGESPHSAVVVAGQQAKVSEGHIDIAAEANIEEAMAWKSGDFSFTNANIETVMRQLGRWYNIKVVYKDPKKLLSEKHFTGYFSRQSNLVTTMNMLNEIGGLHYTIFNQTITIMP